ncbi:MAG TPA: hypothetical protein VFS41_03785 [Edaphobacter sp.]|nr:hypothetical protein [Edaphobacter sp.]
MARGNHRADGGGNNKIRFIMLEADLNDGNLTQITQAISNALRPIAPPQPPRLLGSAPVAGAMGGRDVSDMPEAESVADDEDVEPVDETTVARPKVTRQRALPKEPEIIDNLDLTSGDMPFAEYAKQVNPQTDSKRFLTVAKWFKNYKNTDAIGINHVYTCYRMMNWPYSIKDYDGVFRALKKRQVVKRKEKGLYAINQIGEAEVDNLDAE